MRARFGRDLLLRGRGTDVGVRAPDVVVRLAGATIAFAFVLIAESLGIDKVFGVNTPMLRLVAAIVGAIIAPTPFGGLLWAITGVLVAVHFVVSFTPLVQLMVTPFVRSDAPRIDAQAVIVLSGGMSDEGRLQKQALHRLLSGMQIVRSRRAPSLALSITQQVRKRRVVTSEQDQRDLVQLGAPEADLRFVRDVYSTRDEALAFAALARTHGWNTVVVVTSPMHSARACAALENVGLIVECRPAASRDYSLDRLDLAENRRLAFADVLYESAAWMLYRQRGWD